MGKKGKKKQREHRLPGIRTQLYGAFLLPILLMILLGIFIYNKSSEALVQNYKAATLNTFTAKAEYLDSFMQSIREKGVQLIVNETVVDYYGKDYLNGSRKADGIKLYKTVLKLVASVFGTSTDIDAYYLFGKYGNAIESTTKVGVDYFNEYQESEECKKLQAGTDNFMWTGYHQFLDEKVGISPDAYAVSMTLNSKSPEMYLICDVNMDRMKEILNSLNLGEGSVVGFVSADGREILSEQSSFTGEESVFTSLSAYAEAVKSEKTEDFIENVRVNGKQYCFVYAKIGQTGAVFCGLVPAKELLQAANSIRTITILFILIAVVLAGAAGTVISLRISNTITHMSRGLAKASQGDLTVAFDAKGSEEFRILAGSISQMLQNTKYLIDEAGKAGDQIRKSSVRVSDTMQSLSSSTREISNSFEAVEEGSNRQTEDVMQCAENMNQLADEITLVRGKIDSLKLVSDGTSQAVTQGLNIVGELNKKMSATSDITETVVTDISELEANTRSVDEIVNVIHGLSTQTNLLSLNATIEAARAGSAGRGFSVVAEEIRKLADETMAAGGNIQKLVENIQNKTKTTAESARHAGEIVRSQMESLDETMQLFHRISAQVSELTSQFESIMQQMTLMDHKKQSSMDKIENVAQVSSQSLTVVEHAAGFAAEQIDTMQGLAEESRQLSRDIESLEEAIRKFKVTK